MKQLWYEWKKLISDKSVLLVVVLSMCIVTVSYTHLDVYKRQV